MRTFTGIIEREFNIILHEDYIPALTGAHSHLETLDKLQENLREVIEMLIEDKVAP